MNNIKFLFAFIVLFAVGSVSAQIKIGLPKVKLPKKEDVVEKTKQATGTSDTGSLPTSTVGSGRTSNRQFVIDDAFTFFDAEPLQEYSASLKRQVGTGWYLRSDLRMFGTVPNRSGFKLVVTKAGKQLAVIRCEGTVYRKGEDPVPENRSRPEDDYVMTGIRSCEDKTKAIKETGKMDVAVHFFNGSTDEEKLLRTYKIDVREATRVRGMSTAPVPDVPHYYIQRHAETAAAMLYLRPPRYTNYYAIRGDNDFVGQVELYFNISPQKQVTRIPHAALRCSVNGKALNFPGSGNYADQAELKQMRVETAIYSDRLAAQYKTANEYMDEVSFSLYRARLPLFLKGDPQNNRLGLLDHKGNWECSLRINGETLRTFRWVIGNDGRPVPHAEQSSGNVNLGYNGFLIEAEVPTGGSQYDHRLLPLPNDGIFYGIPWKSAEGKAAASKIPTKGKPYHVPSR